MLQYAKIVKETHWPEVSDKKKKEMRTARQKLERRNKKFMSPVSQRANNSQSGTNDSIEDYQQLLSHVVKPRKKQMIWSQQKPTRSLRQYSPQSDEPDWLTQKRIKRQIRMKEEGRQDDLDGEFEHKPQYQWKSMKKNKKLDSKSRSILVQQRAKAIEEGAARKSLQIKIKGGDVEDEEEVNDMYIDAIEAKLSLLEDV